ncbi:MAG: DUF4923 family protein [Bacteroidaceae bacterium]|nr:DUF4923 family protein [Bacteroidaceae bacterium]
MKKFFCSALVALSLISMTSCGLGSMGQTGTSTGTTGSNILGSLAQGALGASTNNSGLANLGSGILGGVLSNLLGTKTNVNTIYGTWVYAQPKVTFESENVLAKIGSSVASTKIESTLQNQLDKMGFTVGKTTMTFNQDGTCVMNIGGKNTTGKYTYNQSAGTMTLSGALGMTNVTCYVSVVGGQMYMLFDSSKLLSIATGLSSKTSATSSLSSILGNYNGLKLGWTMNKQ